MSGELVQEAFIVLVRRRAPLDLAERQHAREQHVLEVGFGGDVFGPEIGLDAEDVLFSALRHALHGLEAVDLLEGKEASDAEEAAAALSTVALTKTPLQETAFNDAGQVVFSSLSTSDKIYLICQLEEDDEYSLIPVLANLPQFLDGQSVTDIRIEGKYAYIAPPDEPVGAIILNKTDENGQALAGAVFEVTRKSYLTGAYAYQGMEIETDEDGEYHWEKIATLTTDKVGQITVVDIPLGTYRLVETKAPDGYVLDSTPVFAQVTEPGTIRLEKGLYVADQGKPVIITVKNNPIPAPPQSSVAPPPSSVPEPEPSIPPVVTGEDIAKFIIIGVVVAVSLVAVILLFVLGRKKKDKSDDDK